MAQRPSQFIAAVCIGALIAGGCWVALNGDVASDRRSRIDRAGWEAQTALEVATRALERAGDAAARAYFRDDDFGAAADAFEGAYVADAARDGAEIGLDVLAFADFVARDGALTLRRARPAGDRADVAESRLLRSRAERLADAPPESIRDAAPAHLVAAPEGGDAFWLLWRAPAEDRVFAVEIAVVGLDAAAPTRSAEARWRFDAEIREAEHAGRPIWPRAEGPGEDVERLLEDLTRLLSTAGVRPVTTEAHAPIGDGEIVLRVTAPSGGFTLDDALAAAPSAAFAGLLVLTLAYYAAAERRARARDRADRKRTLRAIEDAKGALEQSRERFKHLAESTNVVPWEADLDQQRFTYIGPQIESLSGYPASSWLASGFWAQHIHPGDRHRVLVDTLRQLKSGEYARVDYRVRAADGRIRHVRNMLSLETETSAETGRRTVRGQGFILDVTELREASRAMELARREAENANRVKSEFLASMSHELRTPLNAIIGFSEIMKDQLFGPMDEKYRDYADNVHKSGRHLLDLINDVLDLSKIEAGRVELTEEEIDVGGLLEDCRHLLQERIASSGLHANIKIEDGLPSVVLDERRMKQVILNLLSNAIKFTKPGGAITLRAERDPARGVLIAVRDSGIGMSRDDIPRALSKFGQIDGDLARKHDGTGLGLPIAKSLVEMHGGAFEIVSEQGKGTEMRIWMPQSRISASAA